MIGRYDQTRPPIPLDLNLTDYLRLKNEDDIPSSERAPNLDGMATFRPDEAGAFCFLVNHAYSLIDGCSKGPAYSNNKYPLITNNEKHSLSDAITGYCSFIHRFQQALNAREIIAKGGKVPNDNTWGALLDPPLLETFQLPLQSDNLSIGSNTTNAMAKEVGPSILENPEMYKLNPTDKEFIAEVAQAATHGAEMAQKVYMEIYKQLQADLSHEK